MPVTAPVQPTGYAGWASGPSGSVRIVEPTALEKAIGWQAGVSGATSFIGGVPPSTYFNWIHNLNYQWQKYLNEKAGEAYVGLGDQGDLILGVTTYVLDSIRPFNDIAIGASSILDSNGWPVIARLITGVSGTIRSRGGNGGAARYPIGASTAGWASDGANGGIGVGARGVPGSGPLAGAFGRGTGYFSGEPATMINALGARGGSGGISSNGNLTVAVPVYQVAPTGIHWARIPHLIDGIVQWFADNDQSRGMTAGYLRGGGGGGFGAFAGGATTGDAAQAGGGGAGGGFLPIIAQEVNFQGVIDVRGGDGGTGGLFAATVGGRAGGGGGGGGGGRAAALFGRKTKWDVFYDARPGAGGRGISTGGVVGGDGLAGATGATMIVLRLP